MSTNQLYETDFYGWTQHQANALRDRNLATLDVDNLLEEIESMGRSELRELTSRLEILLVHLLKWQYQPDLRGASWEATIKEQRRRITRHLRENPSLKHILPKVYDETYGDAVLGAFKETGIREPMFPAQCPWTFEQATDPDFWPES